MSYKTKSLSKKAHLFIRSFNGGAVLVFFLKSEEMKVSQMKIIKLIPIFLSICFNLQSQDVILKNQKKRIIREASDYSQIIGKKFEYFSENSIHGKHFSNGYFKNRITLINFWFAECKPCREEFDSLKMIFEKYRSIENFQMLSFTFDNLADASKTAASDSLNFTIIPVSKVLCNKLNFGKGYPTNFIVDAYGNIIYAGGGLDIHDNENYFSKIIIAKIDSALQKL